MNRLIDEKIVEIMKHTNADYSNSYQLLLSLGGKYSDAEKLALLLRQGLTINQIKELHQKGMFKYDADVLLSMLSTM
jgi:hypothetical protein